MENPKLSPIAEIVLKMFDADKKMDAITVAEQLIKNRSPYKTGMDNFPTYVRVARWALDELWNKGLLQTNGAGWLSLIKTK